MVEDPIRVPLQQRFVVCFFGKLVLHLGFLLCFLEVALVAKNGLYQLDNKVIMFRIMSLF
jgi:hypothetical protein